MTKKGWYYSPQKSTKIKVTEEQKRQITVFFEPLVLLFKGKIHPNKNKDFNYIIDIYSSWYRNYFYICEKWKSDSEHRIKDEWESKFVRLEFTGENIFTFSYMRHTDTWWVIAENLTKEKCYEMIEKDSAFQPLL